MSISLEILPTINFDIPEQLIIQRLNEQFDEKFEYTNQSNGAMISIAQKTVCLIGKSSIEPSVFKHETYIDGVKGLDKIDKVAFLKSFKKMDSIYLLESKAPRHSLSFPVLLFCGAILAQSSKGLIILDHDIESYASNTVYLHSEIGYLKS